MQGNPLLPTLMMWALIGAIFYFILLRPQQKQRKAHDEMLRSLKKGDEIVTAGGLVAEVVHIGQETPASTVAAMTDRITVKSGDTRLIVERGRIARVIRPNQAE